MTAPFWVGLAIVSVAFPAMAFVIGMAFLVALAIVRVGSAVMAPLLMGQD